jgi:phosphatidate cytidylyltransferase
VQQQWQCSTSDNAAPLSSSSASDPETTPEQNKSVVGVSVSEISKMEGSNTNTNTNINTKVQQQQVEKEEKKKSSTLAQRVVTALVVGGLGTYFVLSGSTTYACFVAFIVWQCSIEYIGLMTSKNLTKKVKSKAPPALLRRSMSLLCVGMIVAAQQGIRTGVFETASFILLSMLLVKRSAMKKPKKKKVRFSDLTFLVFGLFYCGYLPTFWIRLRAVSVAPAVDPPAIIAKLLNLMNAEWTVGLLATVIGGLCVVAADTGAFFGGKLMGSTPLISSISPNKTMEGAAWGFLSALVVALSFNYWFKFPGSVGSAFAFAVAVYLASVFGDLIESSMKRAAGKKDSGQLLPGHGGLLDRFDSYIFTGVLAYALVYWNYWCLGLPLSQLTIIPPR